MRVFVPYFSAMLWHCKRFQSGRLRFVLPRLQCYETNVGQFQFDKCTVCQPTCFSPPLTKNSVSAPDNQTQTKQQYTMVVDFMGAHQSKIYLLYIRNSLPVLYPKKISFNFELLLLSRSIGFFGHFFQIKQQVRINYIWPSWKMLPILTEIINSSRLTSVRFPSP